MRGRSRGPPPSGAFPPRDSPTQPDQEGPVVQDILQFSTSEYFCSEDMGQLEIQVDRLGKADGYAEVDFTTKDGSAKAGIKYQAVSRVLKFKPGETDKKILISILDYDLFDSVLEFEVVLSNPKGAVLGLYLKKCEVTIADNDFFPTNKCVRKAQPTAPSKGSKGSKAAGSTSQKAEAAQGERAIEDGRVRHMHPWRLIWEYVKMHMQDKRFKRCFLLAALVDQLENLRTPYNLFLLTYLLDEVLARPDGTVPDNLRFQIIVIVILFIVPHPILELAEHFKADLRLRGKAVFRLQTNIMRKFLNYNEVARAHVQDSNLIMAMTRDVPQCVEEAVLIATQVLQKIGMLIMLFVMLILRSPSVVEYSIGLFFLFPCLLLLSIRCRNHGTTVRRIGMFSGQTSIVEYVERVTDSFRIIADYYQKQETSEAFNEKVMECNAATTRFAKWNLTSLAIAPLLTDIFMGTFIVLCTDFETGLRMQVGVFITGLTVWTEIGGCYQGLYEALLVMQGAAAPLQNVCYYMNLPLDVCERAQAQIKFLQELDIAQAASQELLYKGRPNPCTLVQNDPFLNTKGKKERALYAQDLIQIDIQSLTFQYYVEVGPSRTVLDRASFEISQGQLAALVGGRGEGKATLLRLLAGILVPKTGEAGRLFVPPHLRVCHVTLQPVVLGDRNLMGNLCFGPSDGEDEDPQRVLRICETLGMSQKVMESIQQDIASGETGSDTGNLSKKELEEIMAQTEMEMKLLSYTDKCLLNLGRALVMNPDIMIIHKPLAHYDAGHQMIIMDVLRRFVDMRGIEKPEQTRQLRRPRTCIYSAAALEGLNKADLVLKVGGGQVCQVDIEEWNALKKKTTKIFSDLDANNDGIVTREEFLTRAGSSADIAQVFGVPRNFDSVEANEKLESIFSTIDVDKDNQISVDELMTYITGSMKDTMPVISKNPKLTKPPEPGFVMCGTGANGTSRKEETTPSREKKKKGGGFSVTSLICAPFMGNNNGRPAGEVVVEDIDPEAPYFERQGPDRGFKRKDDDSSLDGFSGPDDTDNWIPDNVNEGRNRGAKGKGRGSPPLPRSGTAGKGKPASLKGKGPFAYGKGGSFNDDGLEPPRGKGKSPRPPDDGLGLPRGKGKGPRRPMTAEEQREMARINRSPRI